MSTGTLTEQELDLTRNLPQRWKHDRIYNLAFLRTSNVDKKSEENERPVLLCNYTDVYNNDRITTEIDFMQATASETEIERFSLELGDVVITKDSESPTDIGVPSLIAERIDNLVCGYHLTILRPFESIINSNYLFYALSSRLSAYQFYLAANGVTRFGLTYQGTKNIRIAFPPLAEQERIADFLNYKIAQIDALIAKKKELIEKLREQRIAVITQAVTLGVDSKPSIHDSGIDWLGHVPKAFEVKRAKFVVSKIGSGKTPTGGATVYVESGVMLLRSQNIQDEGLHLEDVVYMSEEADELQSSSRVAPGDVLLNITGASIGRASVVPRIIPPTNVNQHVCILRPNFSEVLPEYLHLLLCSKIAKEQIFSLENGTSREGLNFQQVGDLIFPFPDIPTQTRILEYCDLLCRRLGALTTCTQTAINRLTEYRTALITAATSGKIDVRNTPLEDSH